MAVLFPVQHKPDLFRHLCRTVQRICFYCPLKILQPVHRIVEIRNCLMQAIRRIIRQKLLKMAECQRTFIKILRAFHYIITDCILYKPVHPPECAICFFPIGTAAFDRYHIQRFPSGVPAVFCNLLLQKSGHARNIFHQPFGIFEHLMIHSLKNISHLFPRCSPAGQKKRIVDMSVSVRFNVLHLPLCLKSSRDL